LEDVTLILIFNKKFKFYFNVTTLRKMKSTMLFMILLAWQIFAIQGKYYVNTVNRIYVNSPKKVLAVNPFEKECVILSSKFNNGYLHAADYVNINNRMNRPVLVFMSIFRSKRPDELNDEDRKGVWILTPVSDGNTDVFYIKNSRYGEYLYAIEFAWKQMEKIADRRPVYTNLNIDQESIDQSYMWQFKKQVDGKYQIWNVKFNERKYISLVMK
jgi:hypothetical protein